MPDKPSDDMPGIERIRQIVSLHPWIDARQAAILSGYSRRYADRCLARLIAQGAVQTCRTFGLCTSGKLYAPAGRVIQLANGLTGQDMARALLHIEALWGTRNLLAILAGGDQVESQSGDPARQCAYRGRLLWSASPAKVRYLNARGKPVTLRLPAQGIVAQDGRFIPFVIEWDLGEIVLEGLAQRFAGLCRWSQSAEYRGYQERFPVIVMVTVNERRMWQLLWLWQCTRTRYHAPPLPFYIGVWREIVEERPDAWHSAGSGVSRVTLFQGARAAWPAWRPAPMVQVKPSRRSARDALVQVHLGIPSRQARGVLRCVAAWPLLTSDEVAAVLNLHLREAQISLKGLRELGLIEIFPLEGRLGYTLSPTGIQVLAAANGLSPAQYARWRYWPIAKHCRPLRLNLPVLVTCLGHTRAVRAFFVSLARHARRCRQELALDHALVAWDETESRRSYLYRGRRWTLAPDSSGLYRIGDQQYSFSSRSIAARPGCPG
ncbi:MAG: replication-relaxation family protein [Thermoflexales bacterium]|nr:replication-relaxation family protein [Thermoflexales bacterium]